MEPISLGVTALIIAAAHTLKSGTVKNVVEDAKKQLKRFLEKIRRMIKSRDAYRRVLNRH